jgi:NADH dehydrogenase (ubiquinone) 1 beta subcomplex subunit 8
MFTLEEYTHFTAKKGLVLMSCFIVTVLGLVGTVSLVYPDRISYPREFADGLEKELGGPGMVRARKAGDKFE